MKKNWDFEGDNLWEGRALHCQFISQILEKGGFESIYSFKKQMEKKMRALFLPKLAEIFILPSESSKRKTSRKYGFCGWIYGLSRLDYFFGKN